MSNAEWPQMTSGHHTEWHMTRDWVLILTGVANVYQVSKTCPALCRASETLHALLNLILTASP